MLKHDKSGLNGFRRTHRTHLQYPTTNGIISMDLISEFHPPSNKGSHCALPAVRLRIHILHPIIIRASRGCRIQLKKKLGDINPFCGTTDDDVYVGVQRKGRSLACVLPQLYTADSSDSPLVRHLLTV